MSDVSTVVGNNITCKNWSLTFYETIFEKIDKLINLTNLSQQWYGLSSKIDKLIKFKRCSQQWYRQIIKFKRLSSKIDKLINLTNLSCRGGDFKVHPLHWTETVKKWVKKGRSGRLVLVVLVVLPFFPPISIPNSALTLRPQPVASRPRTGYTSSFLSIYIFL